MYSTYLGGSDEDNGSGIVVDATGIYIAGLTASTDYPTAGTPVQGAKGAFHDVFVTKLNATGTAIIYSTYLGGDDIDYGLGLAVDAAGNAYMTRTHRVHQFSDDGIRLPGQQRWRVGRVLDEAQRHGLGTPLLDVTSRTPGR